MTVHFFHPFFFLLLTLPVTAGARQPWSGATQTGGTEEEVCGEGKTDPQSAREPERTANTAAAAGERVFNMQFQK